MSAAFPFCGRLCDKADEGVLAACHPRRQLHRERERESVCVYERERVCVCVCVRERERESVCERERVSKLVFYAQSTSMVISGRCVCVRERERV